MDPQIVGSPDNRDPNKAPPILIVNSLFVAQHYSRGMKEVYVPALLAAQPISPRPFS